MDEFDFKEEKPKRSFNFGSALLNCGSIVMLIATLIVAGFFALIFFDPQTSFNPLPPVAVAPTEAPTDTPAVTEDAPEATATTQADVTEAPTAEPTAAPTEAPAATLLYGLQAGDNPAATDASTFHPDLACNFMGVAGQVFFDNEPMVGLQIHITGTLNGQAVDKLAVTGSATAFGPGQYYEVQLADQPVASDNSLQITVLNVESQPISEPVSFSTTDSCDSNLILINFSHLNDGQ